MNQNLRNMTYLNFVSFFKNIFLPADDHPIPVMDGALLPNGLLDSSKVLFRFEEAPDDFVVGSQGEVFVTAGSKLLVFRNSVFDQAQTFFEFSGTAGAMVLGPAKTENSQASAFVFVAGVGVQRVCDGRLEATLQGFNGRTLNNVTAMALGADQRLYLALGSDTVSNHDWCSDFYSLKYTGRIISCTLEFTDIKEHLSGLAWPGGIAFADDHTLLITESWTHKLLVLNLRTEKVSPLIGNMVGYPGRIRTEVDGSFTLSYFALRTHLIELILREHDFRNEMMQTIPANQWIAPALASTGHYLEPLQGGSIKKLGLVKPWAPPRSYGLVVQIDKFGNTKQSWHSRAGGNAHGVSCAQTLDTRLLVLSKGHKVLLGQQLGASTI